MPPAHHTFLVLDPTTARIVKRTSVCPASATGHAAALSGAFRSPWVRPKTPSGNATVVTRDETRSNGTLDRP